MPKSNGDGAPSRLKVAVDAMGGDYGPRVVVEGAVAAVREFGAAVILVGDSSAIHREVARLEAQGLGLEIRHASQVVGMAESPSQALRRKRDSSLRVAAELVKDGKASAFISAGNTGAAMAIAMFVIGVLPGVDRPAIAAVLPNLKRFTILLDAGANVDPKAEHLLQFAVMGHVYARDILGLDSPRVGLLSVGEEEGKGNELTKETYEQLRESSLNFVGNVEGRDIYNGRCDVVVTDGFTGNVALKISESLAEMLGAMIKEELMRDTRSKIGAKLALPAFERFRRRIDYTEMGGAPLLGIDGAAIICHGASPVKAIKNAVRVAQEWANAGLNEHIKAALEAEVERGGREGGRE
jgi:glycerol-3-phosphate acyltransferase PlsX